MDTFFKENGIFVMGVVLLVGLVAVATQMQNVVSQQTAATPAVQDSAGINTTSSATATNQTSVDMPAQTQTETATPSTQPSPSQTATPTTQPSVRPSIRGGEDSEGAYDD